VLDKREDGAQDNVEEFKGDGVITVVGLGEVPRMTEKVLTCEAPLQHTPKFPEDQDRLTDLVWNVSVDGADKATATGFDGMHTVLTVNENIGEDTLIPFLLTATTFQ
jgi:hypothetical protein